MIVGPNVTNVIGVFTMGFGVMTSVLTNNVSALVGSPTACCRSARSGGPTQTAHAIKKPRPPSPSAVMSSRCRQKIRHSFPTPRAAPDEPTASILVYSTRLYC